VAGANQFFYFFLKRITCIGGVAIVLVIFAVLIISSLGGGFKVFCGGGMRLAWSASSRRHDLGTLSGVYLLNHGCLGSLGLDSGRGDSLCGSADEGV